MELLDELAGGAREAAWPFLKGALGLSYLQIGFLLGLPALLSGVLEPLLGILADLGHRRLLVLAGDVVFCASLFLTAASGGFWVLLLSFVLFYPASGAFVNLSQAELMDRSPDRRDQNMARWTFAGSAGALVGPAALGGMAGIGLGWRGLYALIGAASAAALVISARVAFPRSSPVPANPKARLSAEPFSLRTSVRAITGALRNTEVVRWLALLELANLMLDVLFGFLALYLVEVASLTPAEAALAVTAGAGAELLGDFLAIPLLEKVGGLAWLRLSAALAIGAYSGFLLAGPTAAKLLLIALVGLLRSGWYAVLQARLYASLPGQSGLAVAVGTVAGSVAALIPVGLGALAQAAGLRAAMWVLLAAPFALLVGLPRRKRAPRG